MAHRLPLVGLRGELGDAVSGWHRGAIKGEKGERWGGKGHFPGSGGGARGGRGGWWKVGGGQHS